MLALEALSASRRHRRSAERVLQDYAALGAEGVSGRMHNFLANRLYVVLTAAARPGRAPPDATELRGSLGEDAREVLAEATRILRVAPGPGASAVTGEPLVLHLDSLATVISGARRALPPSAYFGSIWIPGRAGRELLVFQSHRDEARPVAGVTLPISGLARLVAPPLENEAVLPASLTRGSSVRAGIGLRLAGVTDVVLDRGYDNASAYRARMALGPMFADLGVEVSLSESLAPTLVIGGLPPSRVPLLGALFLLTVLLTIAAGYQLRRELALVRLREDFVASVSHELRTPLAQIRLFAETLRLGRIRSESERDRSLEIVEHESRRLGYLVENVLHFARTERGAHRVRPEPTDLTALVQQVVGEFAPLGEPTGSRITTMLAPGVIAHVDPAAIRQILLNLLDNAIKYGARGQVVTVRLAVGVGAIQLEVEDQGPGVPAESRSRVWERFWRDTSARTAGVTGTGIGLAIVADLVTRHRGTAAFVDAEPHGARVIITLREPAS